MYIQRYEDIAQNIGFNTTISAPHMHAFTLELIKGYTKTAVKALDIGVGSGWITVALSELMENKDSIVYGIDHLQGVLNIAKKNIIKSHKDKLEKGKIVLCLGDGRHGLEDFAPFDIIHLGAAATMKAVNRFIHQLAHGGVLVGPIIVGRESFNQEFIQFREEDEQEYFENENDHITVEQQNINLGESEEQSDEEYEESEDNLYDLLDGNSVQISLLQRHNYNNRNNNNNGNVNSNIDNNNNNGEQQQQREQLQNDLNNNDVQDQSNGSIREEEIQQQ
ncbi:protein-l-isoaspartate, D-aspartate o-methyltransferase, putative [Ichthyophthirius multifiliis]|uniref:protein-L-isoaspartate(D-aspartate) O-methyltransferase n=1 Tax=Ichthyophthirius multifiliis TaxID=5932 RepID=G0QKQ6_ICHMU|nr:protein-l-isoaspartate, D-aspartate o-methyltransferase, putative [Ichthyophthirius multifiliis]EGR34210.1 protein-l-isoaspartate, D-aspartate o-methyltransferase, putative [Ichthyophthirius multifiliis]|eukprot:XP_004039514.1 protein-l-isoaspartate, D-aspartate o-methyltransferase, putative [Ichthyophthirius multifiliis]